MTLQNTLHLLCSHNPIEKDEGALQFQKLLSNKTFDYDNNIKSLGEELLKVLLDVSSTVEQKHGCLIALRGLISSSNPSEKVQAEFFFKILESALRFLTYNEPLICQAAVALLEDVFQRCKTEVHKNWRQNILLHLQTDLNQLLDSNHYSQKVLPKSNLESNEEWAKLEPSFKILKYIIEESRASILANRELIGLIIKTYAHTNHLVREAGFTVLSAVLQNLNCDDSVVDNPSLSFGNEINNFICSGLDDPCDQVRLAASVAARSFLLGLEEKDRLLFFPQLLPRLCISRYWPADNVRIYSQETWRQVAGSSGREFVEQFIEPTVEYYQTCAVSEQSCAREAACSCITELISNMPVEVLQPFAIQLLNVLLACFQDDSWPVREVACSACGKFAVNFPEESSVVLDKLYSALFDAVGDKVSSVQQAAALSLSQILQSFDGVNLMNVLEFIEQGLKNIKNQEANSSDGVNIKYSKQGEVSKTICDKTKKQQPWKTANGCIYLLGELSNIKEAHEQVCACLPLLKTAASFKHYEEHVFFLETFCKQVPIIAKNLGKLAAQTYIPLFIDGIFYALECENRLTSSAASKCLTQLASLLGQNVLRSKVVDCNPAYGAIFESVIFAAPF